MTPEQLWLISVLLTITMLVLTVASIVMLAALAEQGYLQYGY